MIDLPILLEEICGPILGKNKSLTDTLMWKMGIPRKGIQKRDFRCNVGRDGTEFVQHLVMDEFTSADCHYTYIMFIGGIALSLNHRSGKGGSFSLASHGDYYLPRRC
jgi:hypothetical protein